MHHHRKLTDDERRQIIEARSWGTPAAVLAHRFGVSTQTIYNTLSRAKGARPRLTTTISTRLSARQLAGFQAALARLGITDQPAALRRLMGAADILLRPVDPVVLAHLQAWGAQVATDGAAVNHIARKLNEAKLRGRPIPLPICLLELVEGWWREVILIDQVQRQQWPLLDIGNRRTPLIGLVLEILYETG